MSHSQQQFYKWKWTKEANVDMMAALTLQEQRILYEKVKQYPVLFDKQLKGYTEKDVVTNAWNAVPKEIGIGMFSLFSRKNNKEGWIKSKGHLEPSQTSATEL